MYNGFINMAKYFTQQGLEKLKQELATLKIAKKEMAREVAKAASFGDLSENAAYSQAKEKNRNLDDKIHELEKALSNAKIISANENNQVQIGSTVVLQANNEKETFTIVSPIEADILKNLISVDSPIGKALVGKATGDTVNVQTPGGTTVYTVLSVN